MPRKLTTEEFIEKAKKVHGDKYDYSKVEYVSTDTKVCIICSKHGEFWQAPYKHLMGRGCRKCGGEKRDKMRIIGTDKFIERSKKIHNDKYDYSKVEYVNNWTKVCIICPEHGEFWQTPANHLYGKGCLKCAKNVRKNKDEFIDLAKNIHGDKYDYSKVDYVNNHTKVCIICPKHGEFWQVPSGHLKGYGCEKCVRENYNLTTEEFIEKSNKVHDGKYDYSLTKYDKWVKKVMIVCPKHGEFWQLPYKHLYGHGCPICKTSHLEMSTKKMLDELNITFKQQVNKKDFYWLGRQSLDFFLPEYNIAIECQGEQHYKCINIWGGREGLEKRIKLDEEKLNKCNEHNVAIYYVGEDLYAKKYGLLTITDLKNKLKNGL